MIHCKVFFGLLFCWAGASTFTYILTFTLAENKDCDADAHTLRGRSLKL